MKSIAIEISDSTYQKIPCLGPTDIGSITGSQLLPWQSASARAIVDIRSSSAFGSELADLPGISADSLKLAPAQMLAPKNPLREFGVPPNPRHFNGSHLKPQLVSSLEYCVHGTPERVASQDPTQERLG